jgi:hypothetical protein
MHIVSIAIAASAASTVLVAAFAAALVAAFVTAFLTAFVTSRRSAVSQTKSSRKLVATCATIACAAVTAASIFSDTAFAQDAQAASSTQTAPAAQAAQPASHPTRASLRHANHKLEREVRVALTRAKIDTTDILIRAKGGKVALIGAVPDQNMIQPASEIAGKVAGVTAVQNLLILRPESDD